MKKLVLLWATLATLCISAIAQTRQVEVCRQNVDGEVYDCHWETREGPPAGYTNQYVLPARIETRRGNTIIQNVNVIPAAQAAPVYEEPVVRPYEGKVKRSENTIVQNVNVGFDGYRPLVNYGMTWTNSHVKYSGALDYAVGGGLNFNPTIVYQPPYAGYGYGYGYGRGYGYSYPNYNYGRGYGYGYPVAVPYGRGYYGPHVIAGGRYAYPYGPYRRY